MLRGAFETGEKNLAAVFRAGKREGLAPALKKWKAFDGSPGEYLNLTEGLFENGRVIDDFMGPQGLRRFADQYFDGKVQRTFDLAKQVLSESQLSPLGWTEKISPPHSPEREFFGRRIPAPSSDLLPPKLNPTERALVSNYLHEFVKLGRPPSQNELGASAMNRLTDLFGSLPQAQLRIKAYANEFGIPIRLVEAVVETPPGEELRREWQTEAVDLYLEWMLRNNGAIPKQADWGRKQPGKDRVGVDQARMFGSDVYGEGKPQGEYQIFATQQEALLRVAERASELGIPFSLLQQKFRSNETPSELRSAWAREAETLLRRWKDANPGRVPVATDWGMGDGKVGMTYKRFFLQARNPKEWIFEDRAEADRVIKQVFGD